MPWDPAQLAAWDDFALALAQHQVPRLDGSTTAFADHPNLETVNAPIPGLEDREKLRSAMLQSVHSIRDRFPDKLSFVGVFRMSDSLANPPLDGSLLDSLLNEFVLTTSQPKLGVFQETLSDKNPDPDKTGMLLAAASSVTFVMLQALTAWSAPFPLFADKVKSGDPGVGLSFGATNYGARYFELYTPDLDDASFTDTFESWSDCLASHATCP